MNKNYTHVSFVLDNSGSMLRLRNDTIGGYNSFLAKQKEDLGKMTFSLYQFSGRSSGVIHRGHSSIHFSTNMNPVPLVNQFPPIVANGGFVGISTTGGIPPLPSGVSVSVSNPSEPWGPTSLGYDPKKSGSVNTTPTVIVSKPVTIVSTYEFVDLNTVPDLSTETYDCNTGTPLLDAIGHAIDETGRRLAALPEEERPEKVIFVILTDGEENQSEVYTHEQVTARIKSQTEIYNWDFLFLGANQDAIQAGHSYGITRGRSMSLSATAASMGSSYSAVSETVSLMKNAVNTKDVNFDETIRASVLDGTYKGK